MQADLILYALVAAGLVYWLRSILGTRHGDERERPNPFTASPVDNNTADAAVLDDKPGSLALTDAKASLPRNVTIGSDSAEQALSAIAQADPNFNTAKFAQGAQDAFAFIVESFAAGDRDALKPLLEQSVYDSFDRAIADREEKGETISTEIHAVKKADIVDASFDGRDAVITLRFVAEETCVVRDRDGVILSGDPDRITQMNDIWVFARSVKSSSPIWMLRETRDGDVNEDHKTPVPGTI